jgi:hypothetical protein
VGRCCKKGQSHDKRKANEPTKKVPAKHENLLPGQGSLGATVAAHACLLN